ncbi:hypothetical protein [Ramlibacter tataouinensis]|uniref:Roadblock/LAMTOR2 domain-containing protein n=1 Tax=Ramlibacter tataouinensis (strain ATCC BAA-407 / DSM 14655 / LMG 21543 / TTB310) TaxID=365046 RepID=F5Y3Q1_RAMTT|nr:hypothetical protein [Ramlibacter tataouinensis]AEG93708.1 Hypothetical protein Rta_26070 [Ramlibacter tataouinensis TTB310]
MQQAEYLIAELASFDGVQACALVDADTGMAWYHAGDLADREEIAEAAVEFWRVHGRLQQQFSRFGPLASAAYSFDTHVIGLFSCSVQPPLVLVCVADKARAAWARWRPVMERLKQAVAEAPRR